jgi:hypothetical protein
MLRIERGERIMLSPNERWRQVALFLLGDGGTLGFGPPL